MTVYTADWQLQDVAVMGPNVVAYGETPTIGLRLDGVPQRQGDVSMEWRFDSMELAEYEKIVTLWLAHPKTIKVRWLNQKGDWVTGNWTMTQPTIGRRSGYSVYGVTIKFLPVTYTGAGLPISAGETPIIYPGWNVANQAPVADISYSAAIVGDPQVVVTLNGSGSHDSDGVIVSYLWSDNSDAFLSIPDYPYFDPPHEATTAAATFVYEYVAGMPNPQITLTVTDNAGLTGSKTIEVNIAALVAALPTNGMRFAVAGGNVYYTLNGGLSFTAITGFAGNARAVGCPNEAIVWGNESGQLFYTALANPSAFVEAYSFGSGEVTSISVSKQNAMYVVAATNAGGVAYSTNAGQSWNPMADPGFNVEGAIFNQDVANEIGVVGTDGAAPRSARTRNWGSTWETDDAGLPGSGQARSIARTIWLRYIGLQGAGSSLMAATGDSWIDVDLGEAADIQSLSLVNGNTVVAGDASGKVHKILETTKLSTVESGAGLIHSVAHNPDNSSIVIFGGDNGLYKSLDGGTTVGLLNLPNINCQSVDFFHVGGGAVGELIICIDGGGVDVDGVWYFTTATGWVRRMTGLPRGWRWFKVVADPFNANHWALLGNTASSGMDYEGVAASGGVQVIANGTALSPISPLWETTDAGLTWVEVPLYTQSHLGHADTYNGTQEWDIFGIRKLEFDRVTPGKLYVFGGGLATGGGNGDALHGLVWKGSGTLNATLLVSGTAQMLSTGQFTYQSNHANIFNSGEGGPDGGQVVFADANGGFVFTGAGNQLEYITTEDKVNLSPGGQVFYDDGWAAGASGTPTWVERQPSFNAYQVVFSRMTDSSQNQDGNWIELYGTPNYTITGPTYKTHVANRQVDATTADVLETAGVTAFDGRGVSITYAADGVWVGNGMGLVRVFDPFTSGETEEYLPGTYFREVRCDRQFRRAIAAYAYAANSIHVKDINGWGIVPLPAGITYSMVGGLEVIGR